MDRVEFKSVYRRNNRAAMAGNLMQFVSWSFEVIDRSNVLAPDLRLAERDYLVVLTANQNWMSRLSIDGAPVNRAALALIAVERFRVTARAAEGSYDPQIEQPVLMPRFLPGYEAGAIALWRTDTNRNVPDALGRMTFPKTFLTEYAPDAGLLL
ncbi:MAG: hypothetical protein U1E46_10860 [Hyphomicrobiales bacterium]